jgi:hypothetical protein
MASERRDPPSFGNWYVLWGMLLLAIWMAPAPPVPIKVNFARALLLLFTVYSVIRAALWARGGRAPARARAAFVRSAGAFMLAAGLGGVNVAYVIQTLPLRVGVVTVAMVLLLAAFVLDLAREPAPRT